jgi:hypothetical protein
MVGEPFPTRVGVRQGDPLSPLLFGLFIDRLEAFLQTTVSGCGVQVAGRLLQVLLFADDLVLMAETPQELQLLLDALCLFCRANGLTVNTRKTEVVVFNKQQGIPNAEFRYNGDKLIISDQFLYLGLLFDSAKGIVTAPDKLVSKGKRALWALVRRCYALGIERARMHDYLYQTLVQPIFNYGCELWGPMVTRTNDLTGIAGRSPTCKEVDGTALMFGRMSLGIKASGGYAGIGPLSHELGKPFPSVAIMWLRQAIRFWNRTRIKDQSELVKWALMENCLLANNGVTDCWTANFKNCVTDAQLPFSLDPACHINEHTMLSNTQLLWWQGAVLPRAAEDAIAAPDNNIIRGISDDSRGGFMKLTYYHWFCGGPPPVDRTRLFWYHLHEKWRLRAIARLRLGMLDLAIRRGRFNAVPRSERICTICEGHTTQQRSREDEFHTIFECPSLQGVRDDFPSLFTGVSGTHEQMMQLFNNPRPTLSQVEVGAFWYQLSSFISRLTATRDTIKSALEAASTDTNSDG